MVPSLNAPMDTYFNSRPSARGDLRFTTSSHTIKFQFTPLREGRRKAGKFPSAAILFQFTPLREGRQNSRRENSKEEGISIHAPPRGATLMARVFEPDGVFQFTPLREGRRLCRCTRTTRSNFNSRPSARGDVYDVLHIPGLGFISIHAPPRGATAAALLGCAVQRHISIHAPPRGATAAAAQLLGHQQFQFTPLREGRQSRLAGFFVPTVFQFTPLREGRRAPEAASAAGKDFNSRPSARGDVHGQQLRLLADISIHAPPRGATAP